MIKNVTNHGNKKGISVLLVDDEENFLDLATQYGEKKPSLNIKTTSSAKKAFKLIEEKHFDAIISDYWMPDMNGLKFLQELRKKDICTPFILLTGKGEEKVAKQALNLGANKYFNKKTGLKQFDSIIDTVKEVVEKEKGFKRTRKIIRSSPNPVFAVDRSGYITYCNKSCKENFGYSEEEIKGKQVGFLLPDNKSLRKFGKNLLKVFKEKNPLKGIEMTLLAKSGLKRSMISRFIPLTGKKEEKISECVIANTDITERKRAEEREEFLHSLLGHDVGNKTQATRGYLSLLEEENLSDEDKKLLEKAKNACRESIGIIEKVRRLREIEEEKIKKKDFEKIIKTVVQEKKSIASEKGIKIGTDIEKGFKVKAGHLMEEIFENLLENSIMHSEGSKINIRCGN